MKTKLIFTATIAVIALLFIWIFREDLTPEGALALVISAVGNIVLLWKWINQKEETVSAKKAFEAYSGMSLNDYKEMKYDKKMSQDEIYDVLLQQAQHINNGLSATHPEKQVAADLVENLESVIGGGGIKNPPPQ